MIRLATKMGFALVLLSILGCPGFNDDGKDLPKELGDLILSKVIQGNEAATVIHKLHGKMLGAKAYLIGYYGKDNSRNILYLSIFENHQTAKADLMKMAMKMAPGTKVFSPLTFGKMGDNARFRTEGMGLVHYFYRVDNILIWWQVEPGKAESTYRELLDFDFTSLKKGQ